MNVKLHILIIALGITPFLNAQDDSTGMDTCSLQNQVLEDANRLVHHMDSLGLIGRFVPTCCDGTPFGFTSKCEIEEYSLMVFNRWGEIVFETSEMSEHWSTSGVKDGTYTYRVWVYRKENFFVGHFDVVH